MTTNRFSCLLKALLLLVVAGILLGSGAYLGLSYLHNTRLGARSTLSAAKNLLLAMLNRPSITPGEYRDIIFLHHSVGMGLVLQGGMREQFAQAGYQFWDQGYNDDEGMRDPQGNRLEYVYYVPHDNTDPDGLKIVFNQPVFGLPVNTFSGLLQHDVILFKSCFPNSQIASDEELQDRKNQYLGMRAAFDQHPAKLFIAITQPPLNPAVTDPEAAARARALANWLKSDEFLGGRKNLVAYDLFDQLAEPDTASPDFNTLRASYRTGTDSHPNEAANLKITPLLVDFVLQTIEAYRAARP